MRHHPSTQTNDRAHRALLLIFGVIGIGVLGIIGYAGSFSGVFLFDDIRQIVENDSIRDLGNIEAVLTKTPRPLTNLTFALNYAAANGEIAGGEKAPAGFHLVNLLIHMVSSFLLFAIVLRVSQRVTGDVGGRRSLLFAVVCAAIWAVHPLQTQAVTYIIQRSESLMGMFYLLTLLCVDVSGMRSGRSRWVWGGIAIASCALGMMSKSVMVSAPLVALLYDRAFIGGSLGRAIVQRWWLHLGLVATWSVLLVTGEAVRVLDPTAREFAGVGFGFKGISPLEYLLTQPGVILHYLRLAVWPTGQLLEMDREIARGAVEIALPLVVIASLGAVALLGLWRNRWWGFVGAAFFLVLAPTSSFVPIRDIAFEHRMYLPLAGVVLLLVWGAWKLVGVAGRRWSGPKQLSVAMVAACAACVVLVSLTISRNRLYGSEAGMWRDVLSKRPDSWRAWNDLGIVLTRDGDVREAERAHRRALELDPASAASNLNLGLTLHRLGRRKEAETYYRGALELDPKMHDVRANLADLLIELKRYEEAAEQYQAAIEGGYRDTQALMVYAGVLSELGRHEGALPLVQEASRREDADSAVFATLGNICSRLGKFEDAASAYERALALSPNSPDLWYNLGVTFSKRGRWSEAEQAYLRAIQIHRGFALAYFNLGLAQQQLGRLEEARQSLETALRHDASLDGARKALDSMGRLQPKP